MSGSSLLAQLYPYFKGSQEDVATTSLQFILSGNDVLNRAFTRFVSEKLCLENDEEYQYKCQVSGKGEEKERPDMSGYDRNGDEKILCEAKFYAALTMNQPKTYLKRLIENEGRGLIFICPEIRVSSLWNEVMKRAKEAYPVSEAGPECVDIQGVRMGITSWKAILDALTDAALHNNVDQMDIRQLRGYCEKLDSEAFIPFDDRDFGIDNAMKYERHAMLIDAVFDALSADKDLKLSTKGLRATPQRNGYTRYFNLNSFGVALEMDTKKWKDANSIDTPYWVRFEKKKENDWVWTDACQKAFLTIPNEYKCGNFIALEAPLYVPLEEAALSVKEQIKSYIARFEKAENE